MIEKIFSKHPELQKDILALSFLKDPILLATLQNPETVRKMSENHRALIEASETICKALRNVTVKSAVPEQAPAPPSFDHEFSDSSSSSGSEANLPQASTSAGNASGRRITSDFFRRSLAAAQTTGQNSLANISQRYLSQGSGISPSSSSVSVPNRRNIISSSMFLNAMNEVLQSRRSEAEVSPNMAPQEMGVPAEEPQPLLPQESAVDEEMQVEDEEQIRADRDRDDEIMIASFQTQLIQMEEMGLRNKAANIQALMVCNGNLEAAVNLVLAEMNLS